MANKESNITPRQISLLAALILSVPQSLLVISVSGKWALGMLSFSLIFIASYFVITTLLERFINRKIRLIYKFIHKTKSTKKEETYYKYVLPAKTLDEVSKEVEEWATENEQEMELLRQNENFRKEFLQNLSHEFRTPIFAIQGYLETLLNGALENPAVNKKYLEKAGRNIERLSTLLNDLEHISKLERGELPLLKQPFIIQDLVQEVFEEMSARAATEQISCEIKKECELPLQAFADKEKIRQVVVNLVENSIKYGKINGKIIASMYKTDENHMLVELTDDGMGIGEKELNRVFERFYRTETGRSRAVIGSGLGLSICKHIIEAHGQTIHVRSREQLGTTVGFTLPMR
jgi:two-component system phosphate regulon sensor histidine kinase PhoR